MIFPGRWGSVCAAILAVLLCPYRAFAVDKLLIVNGTDMTMKPGQAEPFVGYILVGNDGKIKAIGKGNPPPGTQAQTMNLAKVYVGGDLLVDTYRLQKNDMSKGSREVNQRVARLH